ncbi:MAG: DEAD/DEAH box helicase [Desulfovibrionaceae bacterium]|nr:DEAD/DEAH box helicase [Desulfovibrionaceae bacterium]
MSVASFVKDLLNNQAFNSTLCAHHLVPAKDPHYTLNIRPWSKALQDLLSHHNLQLYSHQALATDHIRAGHNIVVSTPTASGKSLIYNLPVLEEALKDSEFHALYLFPLKALAQDQLQAFQALIASWPKDVRPSIAVYDGDTPIQERKQLRQTPPTVLITNPEMLHLGVLPWAEQWSAFLAGLRIIVVDEAHTYRGVFGSNMAHVFRRLNRILARYAVDPVYVLCTATVGNPQELATNLIQAQENRLPYVIDKSGAPQGPRHFFILNPLESAATLAITLLQLALDQDLRTIVYCQSRKMTELISIWASSAKGAKYQAFISAYRAGFLPEERRSIESKMAQGVLKCVVTTSALELGIDIGGLDVCILVGYPGSMMATLQRSGRVGRKRQESCVFLIAGEDALDQYYANNPEELFNRPPEHAVLNPDNPVIAAKHLECAASEQVLLSNEPYLQNPCLKKALAKLLKEGRLKTCDQPDTYLATKKDPQRDVSLRGSGQTFTIEESTGTIIGSLDLLRAYKDAHPGAVYLHQGKSYVIDALDQVTGSIKARAATVKWFTKSRGQKETSILQEEERKSLGRVLLCRGRLRITEQVTAYEKRSNFGQQLLSVTNLDLPPVIFETEGLWYVIPDAVRLTLENAFIHFMGAIHALEHACIGLLPLKVLADRNDFGGISIPLHPQVGKACIFIYDGVQGGAGLTYSAFQDGYGLLEAVYKTIVKCTCTDGCPSCVHSPKCGAGNRPISKAGAIRLLEEIFLPGREGDELAESLSYSAAPELPDTPQFATPKEHKVATFVETHPQINLACTCSTQQEVGTRPIQEHPPFTPKSPPPHYLVFDVETRRSAREVGGWHMAHRMGVSITVAYDSSVNCFLHFAQDDLDQLFARMQQCDLIIGFNSLRFDYAVLKPFTNIDLWQLPSLDLLIPITHRLHYRLSLDCLAQATLGSCKSSDGLQALRWWKEGKLAEIATYCEKDVELTRDLYLYGLEHGYLFFTNKYKQKVKVEVDFSLATMKK